MEENASEKTFKTLDISSCLVCGLKRDLNLNLVLEDTEFVGIDILLNYILSVELEPEKKVAFDDLDI